MAFVVGSGPAGVAVSHALLKQGVPVTMLDAGIELEQDRQATVKALGETAPDDWDAADLELLKGNFGRDVRAIPRKLAYGSDFPYRDADRHVHHRRLGVEIFSSFACGGLSNVWGGAVLPYRPEDLTGWPIGVADLAPHYRAAFELMPLSARQDDLAYEFPLYADTYAALDLSRQAANWLDDLDTHRSVLNQAGIRFGQARLAVRAAPLVGCVYCGMCLYGCPRNVIYNSAQTLAELKRRLGFTYVKDMVVDRVAEVGQEVAVFGHSRVSRERFDLRGDRVYLAGGVLSSAKIVLESLAAYRRRLTMLDSQYFILPLLRVDNTPGVSREALHTLAQVFLELSDLGPASRPAHLQAYTYNDFYLRWLQRRFGLLGRFAGRFNDVFLGRMLVLQGYLHSDDSSGISARLEVSGSDSELVLEAAINPQVRPLVRRIVRMLFKHRKSLGTIPVFPLMTIGKPGQGFHVGGTFPMRSEPRELETDRFGRVPGFMRVHIVDASVFPTIPAVPITLSVMANAHRIGSLHQHVLQTV